MKQVTYTHLDGNVTIFTANTAVEHYVEHWWDATANIRTSTTLINYICDWGLSTWAKERLTSDEFVTFNEKTAQWEQLANSGQIVHDTTDFREYWAKFLQDPNVKAEE